MTQDKQLSSGSLHDDASLTPLLGGSGACGCDADGDQACGVGGQARVEGGGARRAGGGPSLAGVEGRGDGRGDECEVVAGAADRVEDVGRGCLDGHADEGGRGADEGACGANVERVEAGGALVEPLCGVLVVDKPLGWSSMDVIRRIRRAAGQRKLKAGHAGTLDPLATGVVVCCIGKATKRIDGLMGQTKVYEAEVDLSAFTTTDDREGERREVMVGEGHRPCVARVEAALAGFVGMIQQRPPAFSAIHVGGKRAYSLARQGKAVEMPLRAVQVECIELLSYAWPVLGLRITCGKGTYIRSIARDIGLALGTGGHLASLRRTRVGAFCVEDAVTGEQLMQMKLTQADLRPVPVDGA